MAPMARDGNEGAGLHGQRHAARGAVDRSRACCSTTSSSCSRRSPTRRSTASAKRSSPRRTSWLGPRGNLLDPRPGESCRLELNGTDAHRTRSSRSLRRPDRCRASSRSRCRILFKPKQRRARLASHSCSCAAMRGPHDRTRTRQHPHPLRQRCEQGKRGDSVAARRVGPAPSPDSPGPRTKVEHRCWKPASRARCTTTRC